MTDLNEMINLIERKVIKNLAPSMLKYITSGKILPPDGHNDIVNGFTVSGTDTADHFEYNSTAFGDDWEYQTKQVNYTLNKHSYRTKEFADIDWKESVVIFGCSNVFGVGVDDADTISNQLSIILNRPVINLGVGGSSIDFNLHNSVILNANYPTPKAVVHIWTGSDRTVYYQRKKLIFHGGWTLEPNNYFDHWAKHKEHGQIQALFASLISKQLWKDTGYYEASFFTETADLLDCDDLSVIDKARDNLHPGKKTTKLTAERIAKNLCIS